MLKYKNKEAYIRTGNNEQYTELMNDLPRKENRINIVLMESNTKIFSTLADVSGCMKEAVYVNCRNRESIDNAISKLNDSFENNSNGENISLLLDTFKMGSMLNVDQIANLVSMCCNRIELMKSITVYIALDDYSELLHITYEDFVRNFHNRGDNEEFQKIFKTRTGYAEVDRKFHFNTLYYAHRLLFSMFDFECETKKKLNSKQTGGVINNIFI